MVTEKDIERLALLARIGLSPEESIALRKDFASILDYVSEITTVAVEAPEKEIGECHNVMREDGEPHETGIHAEELLSQAPQREGHYVRVKKVL